MPIRKELHAITDLEAGARVVYAGTDLYRQGDVCSRYFVVLSGWIALSVLLDDGSCQILDFALPGAVLGFDQHRTLQWMVQVLLLQGFRNAARLPIAASSRQTLATDFLLLSNLRKFQVEKDASGTSRAVVALETTLLRMPRRAPVASARFAEATPGAVASIDDVTAAFNTSVDNAIRQVVAWIIETGSAAGANAENWEAWIASMEASVLLK